MQPGGSKYPEGLIGQRGPLPGTADAAQQPWNPKAVIAVKMCYEETLHAPSMDLCLLHLQFAGKQSK